MLLASSPATPFSPLLPTNRATPFPPSPPTLTSAAALSGCTCRGLNCAATNCSTTIVTAFQGSDAAGQALTSGYQIESLNNYSISDFFSNLIDKLSNVLPGISSSSSSGSSITIGNAGEPGEVVPQT